MKYTSRLRNAEFRLNLFFSALFLFGTIGCVITGFSIPTNPLILYPALLLLVFLTQFGCLRLVKNRILRILLYALMIGLPVLFFDLLFDLIYEGGCYAAVYIFRNLCWGYSGLAMPDFLESYEHDILTAASISQTAQSITIMITVTAVILAWYVGAVYDIVRSFSPKLATILALPFFVLCFLVIEATVPAFWAIACLLLLWALSFFTAATQKENSIAASMQTTALILPILLLLAGVYICFPKENTVRDRLQSTYDRVLFTVSDIGSVISGDSGMSSLFSVSVEGDTIDFSSLGKRNYSGRTVMRAESDTPGIYYLRENTYNVYASDGWSYTEPVTGLNAEEEAFFSRVSAQILAESDAVLGTLSLSGARSALLFTPYYMESVSVPYTPHADRNLRNDDAESTYDFGVLRFSGVFSDLEDREDDKPANQYAHTLLTQYGNATEALYTQIDQKTAQSLRNHLRKNDIETKVPSDAELWTRVAEITALVRSSAAYSLDAPKPPEGADFAVWFLEEAEVGYCTYFATAEVMLLRACGIPARLASGYLVSIPRADTETAIRDSSAHAWAEVFDARLGWIPIEATPPDFGDGDGGVAPILPDAETPTEDTVGTTDETAQVEDTPPTETTPPETDAAPETTASPDGTDPTSPVGSGDGDGSGIGTPGVKLPAGMLRGIILGICILAAILLLLFGAVQYRAYRLSMLRRGYRGLHLHTETALPRENRTALYLFGRIRTLSGMLHTQPDEALEVLAEKARFSQYALTDEELAVFRRAYDASVAELKIADSGKPIKRLLHRWIDVYY